MLVCQDNDNFENTRYTPIKYSQNICDKFFLTANQEKALVIGKPVFM